MIHSSGQARQCANEAAVYNLLRLYCHTYQDSIKPAKQPTLQHSHLTTSKKKTGQSDSVQKHKPHRAKRKKKKNRGGFYFMLIFFPVVFKRIQV